MRAGAAPTYGFEDLAPATYRRVRFDVGLDTNLNHADPAKFAPEHPLNPNLNGLHWNWQGGYIYLALEGLYREGPGHELRGYAYHFARDENRTRVNLTAQLDLAGDASVLVDFDIGALLNAPRPLSFAHDGQSTHSRPGDPICAALAANLPGAFRIRHIESALPAVSKAGSVKPLYLPEHFTPYRFQMSGVFPIPDLPRDNPLIEERVTLGREALPRARAFPRRHDLLRLLPSSGRRLLRPTPVQPGRAQPSRHTPRHAAAQPGLEEFVLLGWPRALAPRAGAHADSGPRRDG